MKNSKGDKPAYGTAAEALSALRAGESRALADLEKLWVPVIRRVIAEILHDPVSAEEVARDTMERVWRHRSKLPPTAGRATAWVRVVARNLAFDRIRNQLRAVESMIALMDRPARARDLELERLELRDELQAVLRCVRTCLRGITRRVVFLHFFRQCSISQCVLRLHRDRSTVKAHLRRGVAHLRRYFSESPPPGGLGSVYHVNARTAALARQAA